MRRERITSLRRGYQLTAENLFGVQVNSLPQRRWRNATIFRGHTTFLSRIGILLSQSPLCSPKIWETFTSNCLASHVGEHCRKFASCRAMNAWDDTERSISPKGRDEEEIEEESKRGGTPVLRLCVSGA